MFVVATTPASGGHVNVSPRGDDTLRVLGTHDRDLAGSGIETAAHLRDDGRITLMWCAFHGSPRVVRVQFRGRALLEDDSRFASLDAALPEAVGSRAIVVVDADRVSTAFGHSVPRYELVGDRDTFRAVRDLEGEEGWQPSARTATPPRLTGSPGWVAEALGWVAAV